MINNVECKKEYFKNIHQQFFKELVPILIKDNKALFSRIKIERKKIKKDLTTKAHFLVIIFKIFRIIC